MKTTLHFIPIIFLVSPLIYSLPGISQTVDSKRSRDFVDTVDQLYSDDILSYSYQADRLSRMIFEKARSVAREFYDLQARTAAIEEFRLMQENALLHMLQNGQITRTQYDGSALSWRHPGGELGEIGEATQLAKVFLADATKMDQLEQDPWFFTSDIFHNVTLTGETDDGQLFHLRIGTHGGLEYRESNPRGDGFPLPDTKWVEGSLIVDGRIWTFRSFYTDNVRLIAHEDGQRVDIVIDGYWNAKDSLPQALSRSPDKWSERRKETPIIGKQRIRINLALTAHGNGHPSDYGVLGLGYAESNYGLQIQNGQIIVDEKGYQTKYELNTIGFGQEEIGRYYRVPRAIPTVYDLVQGQALNIQPVIAEILGRNPHAFDPYLNESLRQRLVAQTRDGGLEETIVENIDQSIRNLAQTNPTKRWELAQIIAPRIFQAKVTTANNSRVTTTQFMARLLAEDPASRLMNAIIAKAMRSAGTYSDEGTFKDFPVDYGVLENTNPWLDPLTVLECNYVPLNYDGSQGDQPALLERRTVLSFDRYSGYFTLGFQEVFHEKL